MRPRRQAAIRALNRAVERDGGCRVVAGRSGIAWQHLDNILADRRALGTAVFRRLRKQIALPAWAWLELFDVDETDARPAARDARP